MSGGLSYILQRVSEERLRADVAALAGSERSGQGRSAGRLAARKHVATALQMAGLEVYEHAFTDRGQEGMNVAARMAGSRPALASLLIGAHYDTVPGSPGADDNASGVAALLECARVLSAVRLRHTVEYVAFDLEELQPSGQGLLGSIAFVRQLGGSQGYGAAFILEMVGYTSGPHGQRFPTGFELVFPEVYRWLARREFRGDSLAVLSSERSQRLGRRLMETAAAHVPGLPVALLELRRGLPVPRDVFRSDHTPFWVADIPALLFTDTANFRNPHYHGPEDTPETLDYGFLRQVTCAVAATVAVLAEPEA